jgi:hypothetical protein
VQANQFLANDLLFRGPWGLTAGRQVVRHLGKIDLSTSEAGPGDTPGHLYA